MSLLGAHPLVRYCAIFSLLSLLSKGARELSKGMWVLSKGMRTLSNRAPLFFLHFIWGYKKKLVHLQARTKRRKRICAVMTLPWMILL